MIGFVALTRALGPRVRLHRTSDQIARRLAGAAAFAGGLLAAAPFDPAGLSTFEVFLVLVSIALVGIPLAMGFGGRVMAMLAVPAVIVFLALDYAKLVAFLRSRTVFVQSPPDPVSVISGVIARQGVAVVVIGFVGTLAILSAVAAWGLKSARWPLRGVLVAAWLGVSTALIWPLPILVRLATSDGSGLGVLFSAGLVAVPLILAPVLSWLEASWGMRAAGAMDVRDGLMRISAATAAILASLWIVSNVGSAAARRLVGTPLEGLVVPAGWCAGGVVLAIVAWALWRVPRYLYQEQLRGRFYPRAISDAIWFFLLASATAAVIDIAVAGPTLGWMSWTALGAAFAYGTVRVGTSAPLAGGATPLWIVVLQRPAWVGRAVVNRLASAWKMGPVTIVAPPDAAPVIAGAHLRASAASGRLHHLFPLRSSHLVDWDDSLPPASSWHALPVREIYARSELWAETLGRRVTPDSVVVVINRWPTRLGARPITVLKLLWRDVLGVQGLRGASVKPSDAARLRPTMSAEELDALSVNESVEVVRSRLKSVQTMRPRATRQILVLHHHDDRDFAVSVCESLAGRIDRLGMTIQPWALPLDAAAWRRGVLWAVPIGFWQHGFALAHGVIGWSRRQVLGYGRRWVATPVPPGSPGHDITWIGRLWSLALRSLAAGARSARDVCDIAVLEPGSPASPNGSLHDFFSLVVERRVVMRVIALRTLGQPVTPMFDAQRYAGEIRWSSGLTPKARVEEIVSRLLELRFTSVEGAGTSPDAPAPAPQPVETPAAAATVSMPDAAPVDAGDETPLDVYVALTADLADFRGPLMDAFDHRRDMRRTISILGSHPLFDTPTTAGFSLSQEITSRLEASPTFESPAEARARLEHADVYVLVVGSSLHEVQRALKTVRSDLREARRRLLTCLIYQRRAESEATTSRSPVVQSDVPVASWAASFLRQLHEQYGVRHFTDYRELLSLMSDDLRLEPARRAIARISVPDIGPPAAPTEPLGGYDELRHDHEVLHAAVRPDGGAIVTVSADAIARTWEAATGHATGVSILSVHRAEFSPDGRLIVTAGVDTNVRVWDAASGRLMAHITGHRDQILAAHFSPDGSSIVTASRDGTARLWRAHSGAAISWRPVRHQGAVLNALFSPDGTHILTSGEDGVASLWDSEDGERIASIAHSGAIRSAAFSPDGRLVATAGDDRTARLWDATHLAPFGMMMEHGRRVNRVVFSPDSRLVATASDDRLSHVWETVVSGASRTLTHPAAVHWVSFSPDSIGIATGCEDGYVRLWNASTGELLELTVLLDGPVTVVEFSPDGRLLMALDGSRSVKILRRPQ